jgi:hypothetical protein
MVAIAILLGFPVLALAGNWQTRGMGGGGGLVYAAFSRFNADEMYVATDMSPVFRTTNFGKSWTTLPYTSLTGSGESDVQFTSDPRVRYAVRWADPWWVDQVAVRSLDGGQTFKPLPVPSPRAGEPAMRLLADPASTTRFVLGFDHAIYFSADGGASYREVAAYDYQSSPQGIRLAGVFWNGAEIVVATNQGLFTSSNNGVSFAQLKVTGLPARQGIVNFAGVKQGASRDFYITTRSQSDITPKMEACGLSNVASVGILNAYRMDWAKKRWLPLSMPNAMPCFIKTPSSDLVYLAGAEDDEWGGTYPGVWKSTDKGDTWQSLFKVRHNENIKTGWVGDVERPISWAWDGQVDGFDVSPLDSKRLVFSSNFIYTSQDGGENWEAAFVRKEDLNPANTLPDATKTYQTSGIDPTQAHWVHWSDASTVMAGFADIAATRSTDGGIHWINGHDIGLPYNTIYQIITEPVTGKLYAAASELHDLYTSPGSMDDVLAAAQASGRRIPGAIYVSDDQGASWQKMHEFGAPVVWMALDPKDTNKLYASVVDNRYGGIYVTGNLSAGKNARFTKLPDPAGTAKRPFNIQVLKDGTLVTTWSVRQRTDNDGFMQTSGVFISTDGGQHWLDRSHANMKTWTEDIVIDPHDSAQNTWYVAVSGHQNWTTQPKVSNTGGLYRTTDRGLSWQRILSPSQAPRVFSMTVHPGNPNMAYVATIGNGLWVTHNLGSANPVFTRDSTFLPRSALRVFFNPFDTGELWVASSGNGLQMLKGQGY